MSVTGLRLMPRAEFNLWMAGDRGVILAFQGGSRETRAGRERAAADLRSRGLATRVDEIVDPALASKPAMPVKPARSARGDLPEAHPRHGAIRRRPLGNVHFVLLCGTRWLDAKGARAVLRAVAGADSDAAASVLRPASSAGLLVELRRRGVAYCCARLRRSSRILRRIHDPFAGSSALQPAGSSGRSTLRILQAPASRRS